MTELLEKGKLLEATVQRGYNIYSWLGREAFEELALSAASYLLQEIYKNDPLTKIVRLRRHAFFYWEAGWYKSALLDVFIKLLPIPWKADKISVASSASLRGSIQTVEDTSFFHPPDLKLSELIVIPEFNAFMSGSKAIEDLYGIMLSALEEGYIRVSLVKMTGLTDEVIQQAKDMGCTIDRGRLKYKTDAVFLSASHLKEGAQMRDFTKAFWSRWTTMYVPSYKLTPDLSLWVETHAHHLRDNSHQLRQSWEHLHYISIKGNLPELPVKWIRQMHYAISDITPRLVGILKTSLYAHAFMMLPRRYGSLQRKYPQLILDDEDLEFVLDRAPRWSLGYTKMMEAVDYATSTQKTVHKLNETLRILKYVMKNQGCTPLEISNTLGIDLQEVHHKLQEMQKSVPYKILKKFVKNI